MAQTMTFADFIPWVTNPTATLINACLAEGVRCFVDEDDLYVHEDDYQKARAVYNRLWDAP